MSQLPPNLKEKAAEAHQTGSLEALEAVVLEAYQQRPEYRSPIGFPFDDRELIQVDHRTESGL